MAEKACVKRLQKEYRALCKVCIFFISYICMRSPFVFCKVLITTYLFVFCCYYKRYYIYHLSISNYRNQFHMLLPGLPQMTFSSGVSGPFVTFFLANNFLHMRRTLVISDYVLEGSQGTPFAGWSHK